MKLAIFNIICHFTWLFLFSFPTFAQEFIEMRKIDYGNGIIQSIERYAVDIPNSFHISYNGIHKHAFPNGFPPGIGSSLSYKFSDKGGNHYFYVLSDRGPNAQAPNLASGNQAQIFPTPHFVPFIGIVKISNNHEASLIETIPLSTHSRYMSGLPLPPKYSQQNIMPLTEDLMPLQFDILGIDPESITADYRGHLWICEEYVPSILEFTPDKAQMVRRLSPGNGLPNILKSRQINRGFESITATPNGKIYTAMESTLDINHETKSQAQFIRIVEYNPKNSRTRMLAYPITPGQYANNAEVKIGDLAAINNDEMLIIEQGPDINHNMQNNVYKINIRNASDITNIRNEDDLELEYAKADDLSHIRQIKKLYLFNLRDYGWQPLKMEGITYIDDQKIAVINDNDFGMEGTSVAPEKSSLFNYHIDDKQKLQFRGKSTGENELLSITPKEPYQLHTQLWILHLTKPLSSIRM